ncbi:MAG: archaeosortase/exosortase family protein [Opitutaceae bacterium]
MPIRQQLATAFKDKARSSDFWFHCVLYLCLGLALLPITLWFAQTAEEQSRILHALFALLFACVLLIRYGRIEISEPLSFNASARKYLYIAYGLMLVSIIGQKVGVFNDDIAGRLLQILSIPAYCAALGSFILFVFGASTRRLARTASFTLCAFLLISMMMEPLDWPLRSLAGQWSGGLLEMVGKTVELGLVQSPESGVPQLMLYVNQHPFHVASECNGFGVILTSLLLGILLAIYRKLGLIQFVVNVFLSTTLGFAFNTLRIVIIVLLAPSLMDHYHLMHEIVGTITYWGCLALVWVFLQGPIDDEPAEAKP